MMMNSPSGEIIARLKVVTYGEHLTLAMVKRKMSIQELSEATGISPGTLIAYRKDKRKPSLELAALISKALRVSMDWMCGLRD